MVSVGLEVEDGGVGVDQGGGAGRGAGVKLPFLGA